ncbi:hypothetical protein HHI36_001692 [Cryptolaemus montrouzieri]|uniref:Uncharacterized protein n=1 Tax=Cryptolaemus montrouzieri TaxID=559131 RepID=A0ABD2P8P5_9CUCU
MASCSEEFMKSTHPTDPKFEDMVWIWLEESTESKDFIFEKDHHFESEEEILEEKNWIIEADIDADKNKNIRRPYEHIVLRLSSVRRLS